MVDKGYKFYKDKAFEKDLGPYVDSVKLNKVDCINCGLPITPTRGQIEHDKKITCTYCGRTYSAEWH